MGMRGVVEPIGLATSCLPVVGLCLLLASPSHGFIFDQPVYMLELPTESVLCVISANLNGDPYPDLVVNWQDPSQPDSPHAVMPLINDGDLTFTPLEEIQLAEAWLMVSGDLDMNGFDDLIIQKIDSDSIYILLSQGGGVFNQPFAFTTGHANNCMAVCSLDEDSYPDVASMSGEYIDVWYGNGDGTFDVYYIDTLLSPYNPIWGGITAGDIDLDGDEDLAVVAQNHLAVLYNDGPDSFTDPVLYGSFYGPSFAADVCVGCINGDSLPDAAVTAGPGIGYNTIFIFLGTGGGILEQATGGYLDGWQCYDVCLDDFDLDGALDLASGCPSPVGFFILDGYGDGSFSSTPADMLYYSYEEGGTRFPTEDFDLDGDLDLAIFHTNWMTRDQRWLYVYSNNCVENGCADPGAPLGELTLHPSCSPFSSSVSITCEGASLPGQLLVYDITGRLIRSLSECEGSSFLWDGRDGSGSEIPTGTYLIQGVIEGQVSSLRVVKL